MDTAEATAKILIDKAAEMGYEFSDDCLEFMRNDFVPDSALRESTTRPSVLQLQVTQALSTDCD